MPVEIVPANATKVIVGQTEGRNTRDRSVWGKWPASVFIGLSGLVFTAELIDLTPAINGYLPLLKYLAPLLVGLLGAFAAARIKRSEGIKRR